MERKYDIGLLILRVVIGFVFFMHGLVKVQSGLENVSGFFQSVGVPGFMAYIVAILIEVVGGAAMIVGLGTRIFGVLFAIVMVGAITFVKASAGLLGTPPNAGYELELVLLVASICLGFTGSNLLSLDKLFSRWNKFN